MDPRCAKALFEEAIVGYVESEGPAGAAALLSLNQFEYQRRCHSVLHLRDGGSSMETDVRQREPEIHPEAPQEVTVTAAEGKLELDMDKQDKHPVITKVDTKNEGKIAIVVEKERVDITGHKSEDQAEGMVASSIYVHYLKAMGSGYVSAVLILLLIGNAAYGFSDLTLAMWTEDEQSEGESRYNQVIGSAATWR